MSKALLIKDHPNSRERISKRLKAALDMMVWPDELGRTLAYDEAAHRANITTRSMRKSLERPVVRMYLRAEAEVFRATLSTQTLARLRDLGWQDENRNAAVAAIKVIRGEDEDQSRSLNLPSPHVTIRIVNAVNAAPAPPIESKPPVDELEPAPEYDREGHLIPRFRFDPYR
jgi:hypothetical protein